MEIHEYFHIYLHSFTIVVLDGKDIECEISFKIKHFYNRRDGGTGRRSGLKIRRPSGLGGSTPPPGTSLNVLYLIDFIRSLAKVMPDPKPWTEPLF